MKHPTLRKCHTHLRSSATSVIRESYEKHWMNEESPRTSGLALRRYERGDYMERPTDAFYSHPLYLWPRVSAIKCPSVS